MLDSFGLWNCLIYCTIKINVLPNLQKIGSIIVTTRAGYWIYSIYEIFLKDTQSMFWDQDQWLFDDLVTVVIWIAQFSYGNSLTSTESESFAYWIWLNSEDDNHLPFQSEHTRDKHRRWIDNVDNSHRHRKHVYNSDHAINLYKPQITALTFRY